MDLTPKQQTSEAIRQAETILITSGQHPSVDQVSAIIALAAILRKFGKRVSAVVSDNLPQSVQMLDTSVIERNMGGLRDFILKLDVTKAEVDKLRYEVNDGKLQIFVTPYKGNFAPSDVTFDYGEAHFEYDLAIILGVPTRARIDRVYEQNQALFSKIPVINLDFHRSNENYGAVNLIEPNASSLCEMLVALSESLQGGIIDADIATALLMGIIGSTDRFTASHTTSKSLTVAAQMMAAGAKQQAVVRALYRDNGRGDRGERDRNDRNGDRAGERGGDRPAERGHAGREQRQQQAPPQTSAQPAAHTGQPVASAPVPQSAPAAPAQPAAASTSHAVPGGNHQPQQPAAPVQSMPQVSGPAQPQQPVRQPDVQASRQPEPSAVQPAPEAQPVVADMPDMRPFRGANTDLPIIDPSHIELVQPAPQRQPADAPARSIATEPSQLPPAPAPMADFAAAAELLAQRQHQDDQSRPQGRQE